MQEQAQNSLAAGTRERIQRMALGDRPRALAGRPQAKPCPAVPHQRPVTADIRRGLHRAFRRGRPPEVDTHRAA
jgi:hypothetical protein